jgi:predicted outer membrane repeat protein
MLPLSLESGVIVRRAWLVALAFAGLAAAAPAADWYVDKNYSNCSNSDGSQSKPYCTIAAALGVAQSGDVIHVAKGHYREWVRPTFDVTLIGTDGAAKTILDAAAPVVSANGVNVTLSGFTVENGGPGISALNGATLAVVDCIVTANTSSGNGGGLASTQSSIVTILRTSFRSNTTNAVRGGAIYASSGSCSIQECTFDSNVAYAGEAIDARAGVVLSVEASKFKNHVGGGFGSAIYAEDAGTVVTIKGCTFLNNRAHVEGGAVYGEYVTSIDVADSTFDSNAANAGGAIFTFRVPLSCERCTFRGNLATKSFNLGGQGGAIFSTFFGTVSVSLTDCLFDSNEAVPYNSFHGGGAGAVSMDDGPTTLTRCRFTGNLSHGANGKAGAALYAGGTLTATDCEFTGNQADGALGIPAGPGAILVVGAAGRPATFQRCTIAGNTTSSSGGGLLIPAGGSADLGHTIVAGNTATGSGGAPDVDGSVTSLDWNDFGNTSGLTILSGPNDLLDVDPLFVDPSNGDFSLQSISPCVDTGDPTAMPGGPDVGSNPRLLDGNLDGVVVVDRGAREFNNVHLDVSGTATPGGTLTLTTSGTGGLSLLMIAGSAPAELFVHPFGALFIDLSLPYVLTPFGTIANTQVFTLDPSLPAPFSFWLQEAAIGAGAGNLSNVVEVDVK